MERKYGLMIKSVMIVLIGASMTGCCDEQCHIDKAVAAGRAFISSGGSYGSDDDSYGDTSGTECCEDSDIWIEENDTADTSSWYMTSTDSDSAPTHWIVHIIAPEKQDVNDGRHMRTNGANGFTYPLDAVTAWQNTYDYAGYGACGASYYTNTCHNGTDIGTARASTVYAIGAGTVLSVSGTQNPTYNSRTNTTPCSSGWGYDSGGNNTCNMAVAVQHRAADGSTFVVVYGHLIYSSAVTVGKVYAPGDTIGTIANDYDWSTGSNAWVKTSNAHLHFGVFPGTSAPAVASGLYGWGKLTCAGASQAANTTFPASCTNNGSTAPGTYIGGKSWVAPPSAPTLSSPANAASVTSPVALSWVNGSGTYRSHIMVCTNVALTSGCFNPDGAMTGEEPTTALTTSYNATLAKGVYYWAVRGISYTDYGGWGSYSSVRSFTVR